MMTSDQGSYSLLCEECDPREPQVMRVDEDVLHEHVRGAAVL